MLPKIEGKHPIIIVDTPGFADTRGHSADILTVEKISKYFNDKINEKDERILTAVCFVVKSTENRLKA
jgi:hypothetical protein